MADHDQRFKIILREFFREFLLLFFPAWARRFDLDRLEWQEQEVFLEPPQGERRYLDLVARVPTSEGVPDRPADDPGRWTILVHVEIESENSVRHLRPRMHEYYNVLRVRHDLPVLPIGLYLRVGREGLGVETVEERLWDFVPVTYRYLYVGLPALSAEAYLAGENPLGVALSSLMRIEPERRAWLAAEAMRRVVESGESDQRRYLLCELVQAYSPLEPVQWQEVQRLVTTDPYQKVKPMIAPYLQELLAEAELKKLREITRRFLEKKFGTLPPVAVARLDGWPAEHLERTLDAYPWEGRSLADLGLAD